MIEEYYFERMRDSKMGVMEGREGKRGVCVYILGQGIGVVLFSYD